MTAKSVMLVSRRQVSGRKKACRSEPAAMLSRLNLVVEGFHAYSTLQASAPDASQGWSSGVHSFVWEARNQ